MVVDAFADTGLVRRQGALPMLAGSCCVLVGGVAAVDPTAAIALVIGLGFLLLTIRSLPAGLAMFTIIMFLDEILKGFGAEIFVKVAGGVLATAWAAQVVLRRGDVPLLARDRPAVTAALLGFLLWAFASALWAADGAIATSTALRLSQGVLLAFIVYSALRELRHFQWILGAYVVGALLTAGFGFAYLDASGRLGGSAGNPNELAAFFLPALLICAFIPLSKERPLLRFAASTTGLILLLALLMTGSRGGLVGLAVTLLAAIVFAGPGRLQVAAAALVILGGVVAFYATSASPEQLERLSSIQEDGGTGRSDLWAVAVEAAQDRPLTGVGAGNFPVVQAQYAAREVSIERIDSVDQAKVVHNTYLGLLSELGLIGLIGFSFIVLVALGSVVNSVRSLRRGPWRLQVPVRGFLVGLLGMLVAFTFTSSEHEKQLWLLLGAALTLPVLARRQTRGEGATPGLGRYGDGLRTTRID